MGLPSACSSLAPAHTPEDVHLLFLEDVCAVPHVQAGEHLAIQGAARTCKNTLALIGRIDRRLLYWSKHREIHLMLVGGVRGRSLLCVAATILGAMMMISMTLILLLHGLESVGGSDGWTCAKALRSMLDGQVADVLGQLLRVLAILRVLVHHHTAKVAVHCSQI